MIHLTLSIEFWPLLYASSFWRNRKLFSKTSVFLLSLFLCYNIYNENYPQSHIHIYYLSHIYIHYLFSSVQLLSHVRLFETSWTTARQASLSITNSQSLLKLMSIKLVMPSSHLILCCLLLLLPPIPPGIRVFSSESTLLMRWPKYWSLSFSISPSNEHPRLISFRMNWLDLLAVQGALTSLLQHNNSKTSILWLSAFIIVNSHIHTWLLEKP